MAEAAQDQYRKFCSRCVTTKPIEEFSRYRRSRDGRQAYCKSCKAQLQREGYARRRALDPEGTRRAIRGYSLKSNYGITLEEYEALLELQGGRCAICGTTEPNGSGWSLYVDHDHNTGRVRGLLCSPCNLALGQFGDSPERLRKAALYLEGNSK